MLKLSFSFKVDGKNKTINVDKGIYPSSANWTSLSAKNMCNRIAAFYGEEDVTNKKAYWESYTTQEVTEL